MKTIGNYEIFHFEAITWWFRSKTRQKASENNPRQSEDAQMTEYKTQNHFSKTYTLTTAHCFRNFNIFFVKSCLNTKSRNPFVSSKWHFWLWNLMWHCYYFSTMESKHFYDKPWFLFKQQSSKFMELSRAICTCFWNSSRVPCVSVVKYLPRNPRASH